MHHDSSIVKGTMAPFIRPLNNNGQFALAAAYLIDSGAFELYGDLYRDEFGDFNIIACSVVHSAVRSS